MLTLKYATVKALVRKSVSRACARVRESGRVCECFCAVIASMAMGVGSTWHVRR